MKTVKKKVGLVLPGGGARGAYQVGVLKAFLEITNTKSQSPFDIFSGTSAGAINGAFLASQAHIFDESVTSLIDVWSNFTSKKVYKTDPITMLKSSMHWFLTIISGGFMAGTHAGQSFNTYPLMNGRIIPEDYFLSG